MAQKISKEKEALSLVFSNSIEACSRSHFECLVVRKRVRALISSAQKSALLFRPLKKQARAAISSTQPVLCEDIALV